MLKSLFLSCWKLEKALVAEQRGTRGLVFRVHDPHHAMCVRSPDVDLIEGAPGQSFLEGTLYDGWFKGRPKGTPTFWPFGGLQPKKSRSTRMQRWKLCLSELAWHVVSESRLRPLRSHGSPRAKVKLGNADGGSLKKPSP